MNSFYKVVMPGTLPQGRDNAHVPAHFGITYKDGKLSISGVVGARSNGDCWGSCGQCSDALTDPALKLAEGWTRADVAKLYDVWERWHLNDMRPECQHQRAEGWREKAQQAVTLYHWRLTREALSDKKKAETAATDALKAGETFTPTPEQAHIAALPYSLETHTPELDPAQAAYYEAKRPLYAGDKGHTETKTLGWLSEKEHPDGLLSRPCPVCGYKYGTAWLNEEVPEDVLQWLASLPKAAKSCAWRKP